MPANGGMSPSDTPSGRRKTMGGIWLILLEARRLKLQMKVSMMRNYFLAFAVLTICLVALSYPTHAGASAPPSAQVCQQRVNDTSAKLLECIQQQALWQYMTKF